MRQRARKARRGAAGAALVELLVAGLLLAVAVSALASVMLQSSGQGGRLQRKEQAALQANQVLQALKNYVTEDPSAATAAFAPEGCWNFRDPTNGNACTPGWALSGCPSEDHDVTFLLTPNLRDFGGKLVYTVTRPAGQCGAPPQVSARVDWEEPR